MQTTQPFGDATSLSYNIQRPVIFLVKEVVCDLKVICHCTQTIPYPRPQLMFICNPSHMVREMSICHSIDPCAYFCFDKQEMSCITSDGESCIPRVFLDLVTFSCLIGLVVPSGFVINISRGTISAYVHSPSLQT